MYRSSLLLIKHENLKYVASLHYNKHSLHFSTTAILGGLAYLSLSQYFLRNPQLLHKKKIESNELINRMLNQTSPGIVAHRGGAHEIAENTLEAFEHASKLKCQMLEMDLCLTKDGIVVVSHDHDIKRITGNQQRIHDLNYEEINPYMNRIELEFTEQLSYLQIPQRKLFRVPKFEDVLIQFPDCLLCVDLKEPNEELIRKTFQLIHKHKAQDNIILGSQFEKDKILIQEYDTQQRLFASQTDLIKIHFYHLIGILPFIPLNQRISLLATPIYTKAYYDWEMRLSEGNWRRKMLMKLQFLMIKLFNYFNYSLFQHLRKRGILSIYWNVNTLQEINRAIQDKPTGIMSDVPTFLKQIIQDQKNK